jgi:hypothetical protein
MTQKRAAKYITQELAFSRGYVRTPGGFRHKSFVHCVHENEAVARREEGPRKMNIDTGALLEMVQPEAPPQDLAGAGGGWITWSTWVNGTGLPIMEFLTTWETPPPPTTDSGQLIYLFNALEDFAGSIILQPVLQWGVSAAGGGAYWSVASWYVDSNRHAFCTPAIPVNPGDRLVGDITAAVQPDGSLSYKSEFRGIPGTALLAHGLLQLSMATETLEVYGLTRFSDYPNTPMTAMTQIDVRLTTGAPALNWVIGAMLDPAFGEHTRIVSNASPGGEVDLYY